MSAPAPTVARSLCSPASGWRRFGVFGAFGVLGLSFAAGCGGSASETPFPQSPDEISVYPTLHKPGTPRRRAAGRGPASSGSGAGAGPLLPEEE
jgi:hypothetical protein